MANLTREQILAAPDIHRETVPVPEWGGEIYVRGLSGTERDKFEASIITIRGTSQDVNMANVRAKLAAMAICDEFGKRLFTDADVKALGEKSASALQRVFAVAQRLSGLGQQDVAELTEGIKGNPFVASPSA